MDEKLRAKIATVTGKRPKTVLDHILKHGSITTDDLKNLYGYDHPPRAARDVRECGIVLKMTMVTGPNGRRMASYSLDEAASLGDRDPGGRRAFSKALKNQLLEADGEWCQLCGGRFPGRALQIDHRVPYEVGGDPDEEAPESFMLVCGSCNRAKSWSCEQCPNWLRDKNAETCRSCFWASPDDYTHIATEARRRLDISWSGTEVQEFDRLATIADEAGEDVREYAKAIIKRAVARKT